MGSDNRMSSGGLPLISVVMPVYNGEEFLVDAIRSVQAQTYPHWDLTIGNNRSTDRTLAIAEAFAVEDPRIRVVTYPTFVSVVESHNTVFTLISDDAKYCKCLDADDLLFPTCLEEMVRVAEQSPTVGMVISYVLAGDDVIVRPYKFPNTVVSGREVVRSRFLEDGTFFAGPTQSLLRADIVRAKAPFYNPINYHGDIEAYLDLLREYDLGFVHQILTCMRTGPASRTTSYLGRVQSAAAVRMDELKKFGPSYLTEEEFSKRLDEATQAYYRFLGESLWEFRSKDFWDYHLKHVKALGHTPRYGLIAWYALLRFLDFVGNPLRSLKGLARRVIRPREPQRGQRSEHGPRPTAPSLGPTTAVGSSGSRSSVHATTAAR